MYRTVSLALTAALAVTACVDDATPPDLAAPTPAERPELGVAYDVATGEEVEETALSLAALRRLDTPPPLRGTVGPRPDEAEGRVSNIIFGDDTRTRVTPTGSFPASGRVRLELTFSDGYTSQGTGTMINDRYILTAGHVVYSHDHNGWATKIVAYPGQDGTVKPFGGAIATKLRSVTGWTVDENNDYDYGLITVDYPIGNWTGTYGLASFSDATLDTTNAYLYGYPKDKAGGTQQWGSDGPVEDYDSTMVYYDMDSWGGMSGAGVYRWSGGVRYVFAVHSGDGWFWGVHYNTSTRINEARFNLILAWMATGI